MKKLIFMTVLLGLFMTLSPAAAVTLNGRATPGGTPTWQLFHGPGGIVMITVYWKARSALLFLIGTCDDGAMFVSGSQQDRFTQILFEVDPGTTCEVQARSRRGSTKFWINFRGSGIFGSPIPGQDAIVVTRSTEPSPILDELVELGKTRPPR